MATFNLELLNNNLFEKCVEESFMSCDCILGASSFFIGLIVVILNIYGFYKLSKVFHKINFERVLILLNIIQVIVILFLIITSIELLIEMFYLIQIGMISLIIRKFIMLLNHPIKKYSKNVLFVFINLINSFIFIIYFVILLINSSNEYNYSIILLHTFISLISCFFLSIYSRSLYHKIRKINNNEKNSFQITDSQDIKNEKLLIEQNSTVNEDNDFLFKFMKEKQIKPLYKINLFCAFFEFILILSIHFIPNVTFEKYSHKVEPLTIVSIVFYYLFILVCLINTLINFFCFYWKIKKEYKKKLNTKKRGLQINNEYLGRQRQNIQFETKNENESDENSDNKSLSVTSYEDLSDENSDNKSTGKSPEDNIIIKSNENIFEKNENLINKENVIRESIPKDLDSQFGINRISTQSTLNNNFDKE